MKREDVLFLYLIDNDADVRNKEKENENFL